MRGAVQMCDQVSYGGGDNRLAACDGSNGQIEATFCDRYDGGESSGYRMVRDLLGHEPHQVTVCNQGQQSQGRIHHGAYRWRRHAM